MTDAELIDRCKRGDLGAYEQLYQAHGARMKSVALNLLGNPSDAEDAIQDAFLKIFRSVNRFMGQSSLATWIYRILVNACYDLIRKRSRQRTEVQATCRDSRESIHLSCAGSDHPLRLTLERAMRELDVRQRTAFTLFEIEGFRHREISLILEVSESTSKQLVFQAKRNLRGFLHDSRYRKGEA